METSHVLKESCPPTKPNISWEESRANKELMDDYSRVILRDNKEVAMVVMDRDDYTNRAHQLLSDTNTYKPIPKHATNKLKNKLAQTIRDIKTKGGFSDSKYCILPAQLPPSSMVCPKYINLAPLRPIVPSRGPSLMGWPRNWPTPSIPSLVSPHITLKISNIL